MSKVSERMAKMTSAMIARSEENSEEVKGKGKAENIDGADKKTTSPRTGPGVFMAQTFGREAAEEAKVEAEKALNELKQSRIVKIADLVEIPGRKRVLKPEAFEELKQNLSTSKLIYPITIRVHSKGGYEIVAGHNRVQAYRELNRDTIESNLVELDDNEVLPASLYTNLFAPALPHYEQFKGFGALQELTGKSAITIAQEAGLSKTHIYAILSYEGLPEKSQKLLDQKPWILGATMAARFVTLTREGKGEKVTEAITELLNNENFTEKAALASILSKPKTPKQNYSENIKIGQKKFATITRRNGVITLKLENIAEEEKWTDKILYFVRNEIKKSSV